MTNKEINHTDWSKTMVCDPLADFINASNDQVKDQGFEFHWVGNKMYNNKGELIKDLDTNGEIS